MGLGCSPKVEAPAVDWLEAFICVLLHVLHIHRNRHGRKLFGEKKHATKHRLIWRDEHLFLDKILKA